VFPRADSGWTGVPIITANMDTTGTFEIAEVFAKYKMITAMHKHYTAEQFVAWGKKVGDGVLNHVAVTAGVSERDFIKAEQILKECPAIPFICLDVANGY
jgi:GMP reductase